ncbi:thioredoxin 1 [Clostridium acetobutylicum]|uniref:Thioredoxin n=1 Tax=Clostridium acetobutylicum (strain ATCC 824 / DSM 792 / JCM 1419 / IAM 19013 / LMG 5710 / NBRC 13948 / NRRL B-527 / VKM B-1787 / 2291 / W) TaxID=272562 RepID=Q97IU3_CLOAB|nr:MULTISPECIES: thioredoxin [Clostridium]AAK79514.1 Thioredoxin, trx [Clostridium acetobutylicum ATCC 824]ADZ20599.1 Thioredoxin, trx [Clostridium acetobutylicum EA 2018]AEI34456.1 thioredoxin [Clostridium acetobutylicum DSM 1731]AWV81241.1 thioredoxin [Clostridium acetobutylicum]MBC2392874.1 thioredoxin [Clostridium acetobutylicum]
MIQEINDKSFVNVISNSKKVVVVDFWATWCEPCKMIAPILEEIAGELKESLEIIKINDDKNREAVDKYGISNIPTMLIFKNGELQESLTGFNPKNKLKEVFSKYI